MKFYTLITVCSCIALFLIIFMILIIQDYKSDQQSKVPELPNNSYDLPLITTSNPSTTQIPTTESYETTLPPPIQFSNGFPSILDAIDLEEKFSNITDKFARKFTEDKVLKDIESYRGLWFPEAKHEPTCDLIMAKLFSRKDPFKINVTVYDEELEEYVPVKVDMVLCYENEIQKQHSLFESHINKRFWFNVTGIKSKHIVVYSTMNIFRDLKRSGYTLKDDIKLSLYKWGETSRMTLIDSLTIAHDKDGWIEFNATQPAIEYRKNPLGNFGFYMRISIKEQDHLDPEYIGLINLNGPPKLKANLILYINSEQNTPENLASLFKEEDEYEEEEEYEDDDEDEEDQEPDDGEKNPGKEGVEAEKKAKMKNN